MTPDQLLALADRCVKCGLCLPHCPTYARLRNEADSPRGRIALLQGWASGRLALTPALTGHLEGCLGCRACESACPSQVEYGRLADGAKAARAAADPRWRQQVRRAGLQILSDARWTRWLARAARLYERLGIARLVERTALARSARLRPYHRLARAAAAVSRPAPRSGPEGADLELFAGCMGDLAQGRAIEGTLALCATLGLRVHVRDRPGCCGALLRHNGLPQAAKARRRSARRAPREPQLAGLASACIAELREGRGAAGPSVPIAELCELLDRLPAMERLALRPVDRPVLVHEPCSHRHLLGGNAAVYRLLRRIPGLDPKPLPGNETCCGAAGTYLLKRPAMAEALLADKLAALADLTPAILVTTNPACALHLAAGTLEAGLDIEVCHPVEVLLRSSE